MRCCDEKELVKKTFTFGLSSIRVCVPRATWAYLLRIFDDKSSGKKVKKYLKLDMASDSGLDAREQHYFNLSPSGRLSAEKMRKDGALLPFGAARTDFRCLNPTFFTPGTTTKLSDDSHDPMKGFLLKDILASGNRHNVPVDDIYGHLYFHIRDELETFITKLSDTMHNIHFYNEPILNLPKILNETLKPFSFSAFDRIDASTSVETIGLEATLLSLGPLLKTSSQSKYATLLTHHLTFTAATKEYREKDRQADNDDVEKVCDLLSIEPPHPQEEGQTDHEYCQEM